MLVGQTWVLQGADPAEDPGVANPAEDQDANPVEDPGVANPAEDQDADLEILMSTSIRRFLEGSDDGENSD